jgi:hypothetical protein
LTQDFDTLKALETAVLFIVFNRPNTTRQVFEAIRKAKPPRLYIASDGPRSGNLGEADRVEVVRKISTNVDWPCEVKTLFRDRNMGCKHAVSGAISWFFEFEEQGIILEDDCLPSHSFFWYCEELLGKYKFDEKIYLISGDARGSESANMQEDYGFCKYPLIWGWASWANIWSKYNVNISDWPNTKNPIIESVSDYPPTKNFWKKTFDDLYEKKIDTWDYQFAYLLLMNKAKCIVPRVNLISNIGFGVDATHTHFARSQAANKPIFNINIPLRHEVSPISEIKINNYFDKNLFRLDNLFIRLLRKLFNYQ